MNKILLLTLSFGLLLSPAYVFAGKARKKMAYMTLKKLSESVPASALKKRKKVVNRNLGLIKPPSSNSFFVLDENPLKAEYNKLIDEEIRRLYKLSKKYKTSRSRGEIWLRLGERYVEKGTLIDYKAQDVYEKKLSLYDKKKIKYKPKPPGSPGKKYHLKAIQLYEWFVRDFPKDPKIPQALYFLGYSNMEVNRKTKGEGYFKELTRRFPKSQYIGEANLSLAEYYFEREKFQSALKYYTKVTKLKRNRLYGFALYKSAWCQYRMSNYKTAVKTLEKVIRANGLSAADIKKLRLKEEAVKDYVGFYSSTGKYKEAPRDFSKVTPSKTKRLKLLDALAYRYSYSGNIKASSYIFKKLISYNPESKKAAKYQYQVVQDLLNINQNKSFNKELIVWINKYGPNSYWAEAHASDKKLLKETYSLQETTLRNNSLRLHQTAINVKTQYSRGQAASSYNTYLKYFNKHPKSPEMRFFYAELLYDMKSYEKAADNYRWVAVNAPNTKYYEKAIVNNVLSLEKTLPTNKQLEARRKSQGEKIKLIPYTSGEKKFEGACKLYLQKFPKGKKAPEIEKRLAALYYAHNDFDPSLKAFRSIIAKRPNSKDAPFAAEYILDIHNLRKDIPAFQKEASVLMKNKTIASSKVGKVIKNNLNKAEFIVANDDSKKGNYKAAALKFESFAKKNPSSDQAFSAIYNAGANYQKAGDVKNTIRTFENVISSTTKSKDRIKLKQDARLSLAELYKKVGQFDKSAQYFYSYGLNSKGSVSKDAINNAVVLWTALNKYEKLHTYYRSKSKSARKSDKAIYSYERAELFVKQKKMNQAIYHYDQFLKYGWKHKLKSMKSMFSIADYHRKKGNYKTAKTWYDRCIGYYKSKPGKDGVKYAALSKLENTKKFLKEMKAISLGTREKTIVSRLQQIKDKQKKLISNLASIIKYDYGPTIVAALAMEGESYEIIANKFSTSPVPIEYAKDPKTSKTFKDLAMKESANFRNQAKGVYKNALEKGISLGAYSDYLLDTLKKYKKLAPEDKKYGGEIINLSSYLYKGGA